MPESYEETLKRLKDHDLVKRLKGIPLTTNQRKLPQSYKNPESVERAGLTVAWRRIIGAYLNEAEKALKCMEEIQAGNEPGKSQKAIEDHMKTIKGLEVAAMAFNTQITDTLFSDVAKGADSESELEKGRAWLSLFQ
jgi:hypothetical protein